MVRALSSLREVDDGWWLAVIALLVYYEIQMGKICQFCTMAHIANIVCLFGFWRAGKMHDEGTWNDITPEEAKGDSAA